MIRRAPAFLILSLERKPQFTPKGKQPEARAVSTSISESPTKMISAGVRFSSTNNSQTQAGSGLRGFPLISPWITAKEPGGKIISVSPKNPGFDFSAVYTTPYGEIKITCKNGEFEFETTGEISLI